MHRWALTVIEMASLVSSVCPFTLHPQTQIILKQIPDIVSLIHISLKNVILISLNLNTIFFFVFSLLRCSLMLDGRKPVTPCFSSFLPYFS